MIRYEPSPDWLRDILHFPVSYALRRALLGALGMSIYAIVLTFALDRIGGVSLRHSGATVSVSGVVISLALAFRLNNAYARWWEGRTLWGTLVNHCRNFAAVVEVAWPAADRRGRQRIAGLLGDFAVGLSLHLRGQLDATALESLDATERETAAKRRHKLSFVSQLVWQELERRRADATLDTAQVLLLQPHAHGLLDVAGACERIRNTPIPFAVTVATRLFLLCFSLIVPLGLHDDFGYAMVPIAAAAFFALAVTDVLAAELENPFGLDCNDLPTRAIAEMIRRDVHEILAVERVGEADVERVDAPMYAKLH